MLWNVGAGLESLMYIYIGSIWWEIDFPGIHSRVIKTRAKNKIAAISLTSSCTDYVISGHRGQKSACKILLQT